MTHDSVAPLPYGQSSLGATLAEDAETVGVVYIEQGVVGTREVRKDLKIGGVPGHAVDSVDADQARLRVVLEQ